MKVIKNIRYSNIGHERQVLDLYLPDCDTFPVFVYFHGGGIEKGSKDGELEKRIGETLAKNGIAAICANYRMYPTAVYPEFIRDGAAVVAWAFNNITEYGKCMGVYVGGSSAGGYISMMLAFDNKYLAPYKLSPMDIAGFVHDAGQPTAHFNVLRERGIDSRKIIVDESAPLYHIGTAKELPPMLFLVATNDMQNRLEQTKLVESTLKHFGFEGDKYEVRVLEGTHTRYTHTCQEEIIINYINKERR